MTLSPTLADFDPEIAQVVRNEERRQNEGLELIAAENFVRRAILEAAGPAREEEIARMLGGKASSALAHARALLAGA